MPTLVWLDGFRHQWAAGNTYASNAVYDSINRSAGITAVTGRRPGEFALQVVEDGVSATSAKKTVGAGNRVLVDSFYFKISTLPSVDSDFRSPTAGTTAHIGMVAANGNIFVKIGTGTQQTLSGNFADGQWHLCDFKYVTSANPNTLDV